MIKMYTSQRAIKFENVVIACGILQCVILIFSITTKLEIFVQLIVFVNALIYLNILRRLIRILLILNQQTPNVKGHKTYFIYLLRFFIAFNCLNVILICIFYSILTISDELTDCQTYIQISHSLLGLFISLVLLVVGIHIKSYIPIYLEKSTRLKKNLITNSSRNILKETSQQLKL